MVLLLGCVCLDTSATSFTWAGAWAADAGVSASVAESQRDIQEKASLAASYNERLHNLSKEYETALRGHHADQLGKLQSQAMAASQQYLKDLGELIKSQDARLKALQPKAPAQRLAQDPAQGSSRTGQPATATVTDIHPEVVLDGSAVPKEVEFSGQAQPVGAPVKKSLREQILDEVRAKLGIKPKAE